MKDNEENFENVDIISISYDFFEMINNYSIQANLIDDIDNSAQKYADKVTVQREFDLQKSKI